MLPMVKNMDAPLFNQVTNLMDIDVYKKKMLESTSVFDYQTAIVPSPPCYMTGYNLQNDVSPSGKLIDVETYLRTQPMREELAQYVIDDSYRDKAPELPEILQNRVEIPDCQDVLQTSYDEMNHKIDGVWNREYNYGPSQFAFITDPPKQQYVASIGVDTRMTMRDEYKKRMDAKKTDQAAAAVTAAADAVTAAAELDGLQPFGVNEKLLMSASVANATVPAATALPFVIDPNKTLSQLMDDLHRQKRGTNPFA